MQAGDRILQSPQEQVVHEYELEVQKAEGEETENATTEMDFQQPVPYNEITITELDPPSMIAGYISQNVAICFDPTGEPQPPAITVLFGDREMTPSRVRWEQGFVMTPIPIHRAGQVEIQLLYQGPDGDRLKSNSVTFTFTDIDEEYETCMRNLREAKSNPQKYQVDMTEAIQDPFREPDPLTMNEKNYLGFTQLHYAAAYGKIELVKKLLDLGADIHVLDGGKKKAVFWAERQGYPEVMELLEDAEEAQKK